MSPSAPTDTYWRGCLLQSVVVGALTLLAAALLGGALLFVAGRQVPPEPPQAGGPGPAWTPTPAGWPGTVDAPAVTPTPVLVDVIASPTSPGALPPTPTPWAENPEGLQFQPPHPNPDEPVIAAVSGTAATGCTPVYVSHERLDNGYLPIELTVPEGPDCAPAETAWALTVDLGVLPTGSQVVEVWISAHGERTRHAARLLYVNPQPLPPPATVPPGASPTSPPTPTPYAENPDGMSLLPVYPTTAETTLVTVRGTWPSGCVPELSDVAVLETGYIIVRLTTPGPAVDCTTAETAWRVTAILDPLPAGSYLVVADIGHGAEVIRHAARSLYVTPATP